MDRAWITLCAMLLLGLGCVSMPDNSYQRFDSAAATIARVGDLAAAGDQFPELARNRARADREELLSLWARSSPVDSSSGRAVLPSGVLKALNIEVLRNAEGRDHVHAGLMHSYGYLFSTIDTPYGRKGKRWVEDRLDLRLGLPAGAFSVSPPDGGEFLSNLTWALLNSVGRWNGLAEERKQAVLEGVSSSVRGSSPRSVENVIDEPFDLSGKPAVARTGFVPLDAIEGRSFKETVLLVYWLEFREKGSAPRLVTAFPIQESFRDSLLKKGPELPFRAKYNLVLD